MSALRAAGRGLIVAGTHSGVGKTTVTSAIAAALAARGLTVQPYKAGPDYIDPGHLSRAAGREARNLDTWMIPRAVVAELFGRAARGADVTLVEGVMGLFDGRGGAADGGEDEGSAADLARVLGLPVLLVVDASAVARSIAATVLGFQTFDPRVHVAGVILNRVGGEAHAEMCRSAIVQVTGIPVVGWFPRRPEVAWPERHLGLVPDAEDAGDAGRVRGLAALAEIQIDLDLVLRIATPVEAAPATGLFPSTPPARRVPIAFARDRAFHFTYPDALELLEAWGADLLPFSPLEDAALPEGARAVLLGGGFPEVFARELASNRAMHEALRGVAALGVPVYGECGGLMYLGRALTDAEGTRHAMAGLLPCESTMHGTRLTLGYREAESLGTPLLPAGERVRGHEFHYSRLTEEPEAATAAYRFTEQGRVDGVR
ncbi:MAG: cobyrinate a,c-diamide synthase, partial [Chloroflexi bacterium]|nr:cobyrinate a,c-diamide synthase [Chloroflexota bacterium]